MGERMARHKSKRYGICPYSHDPAEPLEDAPSFALCRCGKKVPLDSKGQLRQHRSGKRKG